MPIALVDAFKTEIERPQGSNPFVWLWELEVRRADAVLPQILFRVCNWHEDISWPASSPSGETWYPYNFEFTSIEQNQEGDLPQVQLSVDNTARTLMRHLHDGQGLEGNRARLILVPSSALAAAYPNHVGQEWKFSIAGASADDEAVSFRLESANFFRVRSPQDRYVASRCRLEFGGDECGYVINAVAAFTSCPKTVDACTARGLDHAARGLPVLHPRRFGGFPGIQRQR